MRKLQKSHRENFIRVYLIRLKVYGKLFKKIDADVQVGQNVAVPKTKEKPQGFWVQLKEAIKNFFRNLFR